MKISNTEFIAEKLIQCYNVFVVKFREKYYEIIENHPDQKKKTKKDMILHNIYALRMNVDLGFKQFMMKQLHQVLLDKITKESIKKLLLSIFDELERPPDLFFNIFNSSSDDKFQINLPFLEDYKSKLFNVENLDKFFEETEGDDIKFLKKLLGLTENNTALSRAIEDFIDEFETGVFFSRYFRKGEIRRFLLYHFNKYIINILENRISRPLGLSFNLPLLKLIPEFYLNLSRISEILFEALKDLFDFPKDIAKNYFSLLSIHFMSILMTLIFEEFSFTEKINLLNNFYEFTFESTDIEVIANNFEHYKITTLPIEFIKPSNEKIEISEKGKYLLMLGNEMFNYGLHEFSIFIYEYLHQIESNQLYKTLFLDNIATAYRDVGQYINAIEVYQKTLKYYYENELNYKLFLVRKNIAYCYFQMGNLQKSNEIFHELESDFSVYDQEELFSVYFNLAVRYRLIFHFEKEEFYLNLILEKMDIDDPRYNEVQDRSLEIGSYFNPNQGKLDIDKLKRIEINRSYENNIRRAYTYLNNYNLKIGELFLKKAYKDITPDIEYWRFLSNICILKEKWNNLEETSEEILKLDSLDFFGHFFKSLYYIHIKDNNNLLSHILDIESATDSFSQSNSLAYERMSNTLHFICRSYTIVEIKNFIDFTFNEFEKTSKQDRLILKLILFFAVIFSDNNEQLLSGHIYKKYMDMEQSQESYFLYAVWCYRFNDYKNAKHFYKKALSTSPNSIKLLEGLSRVCFMLNQFNESLDFVDKILETIKPEFKKPFSKLREHIILIRDEKIRYENLPFNDVKTIFNTVEYQLKSLNPNEDIDFGIILTQISKGFEILLAKTLGMRIYEFIKKKYSPIPQILRQGNNRDIKPINVLLLNFLDNPPLHNPTLGNWNFIIRGSLEHLDPQNPVIQNIYNFLSRRSIFSEEKLKSILDISHVLLDERNLATHKKLYTKEEVSNILTKLIPLINKFMELL